MRCRLLSLSVLLACAGALPACSALGLDNLPQADCMRGAGGVMGDAFCASLATESPPMDTCHTWQCNEQSHHCEQLARDDDGDGAPTMMCAPTGVTPDCDDTSASNSPTGTVETCDGLDQNCDGIPDDGAIASSASSSSLTTIAATPDQHLLAYQPDADQALVVVRSAARFSAVTITTTASATDLVFSQMGSTVPPTPSMADGAITALGSGTYALAARRIVTAGCQQWALFPVSAGTAAVTLRAAPPAVDESLLPACPGGAQQLTAPAIAGHANGAAGSLLLMAWLAGTDDPGGRACGAAPELPVAIAGAAFDPRTGGRNRVGADVVTLGSSVSNGPPTVLALDDAFLVAYARRDMTIAVHLVSVTVDAAGVHITASMTPDYVEPAGAMLAQSVGLALGPTTGGATSIALSYVQGCGGSNPITVRLLTRNASTITASSTPATGLGTGLVRSFVRVAYQPRANEWLVGWRSNAAGLSVQRLFEDGAPEGAAFDVVPSTTVAAFALEPLGMGPLYRAIVADGTNLNQVTFGCAAP